MRKKLLSLLFALLVLSTASATVGSAAPEVKILVDGSVLETDVQPIIINDRIMLPLRVIFEKIGAKVSWDESERKITATLNDTETELWIGKNEARVNEEVREIDSPAFISEGRTMVPLRFIGESFGLNVEWDTERRSAMVWTISKDILDGIKKFDENYNFEILRWVASLYDPETGGFYYSVSARDNEGFEPDIESTSQVIDILQSSGILPKGVLDSKSIPDKIRLKMLEFFRARQSEDDGYFYDRQFGKAVGDSKRERNLSQAKAQITKLGGKPLYPLPTERLAESENTSQKTIDKTKLPDYLQSSEAFMNYIKALPWDTDPYSAGNRVAANKNTAKELGYEKELIEYIKSIQNPQTGLWGEGTGLMNTNAAMKVGGLFTASTEPYPNIDKMVKSTIKVIENETPKTITDVWNPLVLIWRARYSYPEFPQRLNEKLADSFLEIMELTMERVARFRKADNGYSYNLGGSSPISQGATVSLGLPEGDVNATCMAVTEMRSSMCACLGISKTPLWDIYADEFWELIENAKPIEKKKYDPVIYKQDFSGYELKTNLENEEGFKLRKYSGDGYAKVKKDPYNKNNRVMELYTGGSSSINLENSFGNANKKTIVTEFDFMIDEEALLPFYYITIGATTACIVLRYENGYISLAYRTSESGYGKVFKTGLQKGEWYSLKVIYTPGTADEVNTKYFVNGELCMDTGDYYNYGDVTRTPVYNVNMLTFFTFSNNNGSLYIDNIKVTSDNKLNE